MHSLKKIAGLQCSAVWIQRYCVCCLVAAPLCVYRQILRHNRLCGKAFSAAVRGSVPTGQFVSCLCQCRHTAAHSKAGDHLYLLHRTAFSAVKGNGLDIDLELIEIAGAVKGYLIAVNAKLLSSYRQYILGHSLQQCIGGKGDIADLACLIQRKCSAGASVCDITACDHQGGSSSAHTHSSVRGGGVQRGGSVTGDRSVIVDTLCCFDQTACLIHDGSSVRHGTGDMEGFTAVDNDLALVFCIPLCKQRSVYRHGGSGTNDHGHAGVHRQRGTGRNMQIRIDLINIAGLIRVYHNILPRRKNTRYSVRIRHAHLSGVRCRRCGRNRRGGGSLRNRRCGTLRLCLRRRLGLRLGGLLHRGDLSLPHRILGNIVLLLCDLILDLTLLFRDLLLILL